MAWKKMEICVLLATVFLFASAKAGGTLGYGEECSALKGIGSVVGLADEKGTCNSDKHLFCAGNKCTCNPAGYTYQQGWLGVEFLGGGCKLRANGLPCKEADVGCVANSECNTVCSCKEGFRFAPVEGECSSGAVVKALIPLSFLGVFLSYFRSAIY